MLAAIASHPKICAVARAYGALVAAHSAASAAAREPFPPREVALAANARLEACHEMFERACADADIDPIAYITARRS